MNTTQEDNKPNINVCIPPTKPATKKDPRIPKKGPKRPQKRPKKYAVVVDVCSAGTASVAAKSEV